MTRPWNARTTPRRASRHSGIRPGLLVDPVGRHGAYPCSRSRRRSCASFGFAAPAGLLHQLSDEEPDHALLAVAELLRRRRGARRSPRRRARRARRRRRPGGRPRRSTAAVEWLPRGERRLQRLLRAGVATRRRPRSAARRRRRAGRERSLVARGVAERRHVLRHPVRRGAGVGAERDRALEQRPGAAVGDQDPRDLRLQPELPTYRSRRARGSSGIVARISSIHAGSGSIAGMSGSGKYR